MKKKLRVLSSVAALALSLGMLLIPSQTALAAAGMNVPTPIAPGDSISCEFTQGEQYYTYTMTLPSSGTFTCLETGVPYYKFQIYDVANERLTNWEHAKNSTNSYSTELLAGEYTIQIPNSYWNSDGTGTASIVTSFTPSGETRIENYLSRNNDAGTATSYSLNSKVIGHLAANDKCDMYVFKVTKAGFIHLSLTNNKMAKVNVECANLEGNIRYEQSAVLGSNTYSWFVPQGTYYLSFKQYDGYGVYQFSVSRKDIPKTSVKRITPKSKKLWRGRDRYLVVKWTPNKSVSGYQVMVSTDKKFKRGKKSVYVSNTSWSSNSKCEVKNLKKARYYIRIRTYVNDNQNVRHYSAWSPVRTSVISK